jgi:4-hydroxy-tetrahydrodipicolinate reductase
MKILIVGRGKLAGELERDLPAFGHATLRWSGEPAPDAREAPDVVVHAGSGRELPEVLAFCERLALPLVELSTDHVLPEADRGFPIVRCANTNVLMLKFMSMLRQSGHLFSSHPIQLLESHQASKQSVPGTAVVLAGALGVAADAIVSVRAPAEQRALGIDAAHLGRHALHVVTIEDGACRVTLEARVVGDSAYAAGVDRIVRAIQERPLECRVYDVLEFADNGWL